MSDKDFRILREDTHKVNSLKLERQAYVAAGGVLSEEFAIFAGERIAGGAMWEFKPKASHDPYLSVMDFHWQHLCEEFQQIAQETDCYYFAKTGKQIPESNPLSYKTFLGLSGTLLDQQMPNSDFSHGIRQRKHYPLTTISHRLGCMRDAVVNMGEITLDKFENTMMSLTKRMYRAAAIYKKLMVDTKRGEIEATAGEDDDGDNWPGADNEPLPSGSGDDVDALQGWQDGNSDVDDARDNRVEKLFENYIMHVVDFTDAANRIWMEAVEGVVDNLPPQANNAEVTKMHEALESAQNVYQALKEETQDMSAASYEMQPFFALLEDPEKGVEAKMQRLASMASRPAHMAEIVRKCLPRKPSK